MIPHRIGSIGLMGMIASGMLVRDNGLAAPARLALQTNTAEPAPVIVESRQVRRARERREAKNTR